MSIHQAVAREARRTSRLAYSLACPLTLGMLILSLAVARPAQAAALAPGAPTGLFATTITVNTTADELNANGNCSLREAIRAANLDQRVDACAAGAGADTIVLPAGSYLLTLKGAADDQALSGDLDITADLRLLGQAPSTTLIDGQALDRVVQIGTGATVVIAGMTIQNGASGSSSGTLDGGGVLNSGSLSLRDSVVQSNRATSGGGILNKGTLSLQNTSVRGNIAASAGGGIFNSGTLTAQASSISTNSVSDPFPASGGGITNKGTATITAGTLSNNRTVEGRGVDVANDGTLKLIASTVSITGAASEAIDNSATITLQDSTVSSTGTTLSSYGNVTVLNSTISGSHMWNHGTLTFRSSTVRSDTVVFTEYTVASFANTIFAAPLYDLCFQGTLKSEGYNLFQKTNCPAATGDRLNVDPRLGPLQNNGGATATHALLAGSPAIDAGNPALPGSGELACPVADQRGVARAQDGDGEGRSRCDIGSYEVSAPNLLKNGGFESDTNADSRPDGWSSNSHFTRSSATAQSGRYAGRHRATDNSSYTVYQTIYNMQAGKAYTFGGYVKIPSTSDGFTFRLQLVWRNASKVELRTDTIKSYADDTAGAWRAVGANRMAPAGTTNLQVRMVVSSLNATIYVDSFGLRLAPISASPASAADGMGDLPEQNPNDQTDQAPNQGVDETAP